MPIKTILFDMGNVLVYFSHEKMCQQIGQLCNTTTEQIREAVFESEIQWNFERGFVSEDEFQAELEKLFSVKIDLAELKRATADIFCPNTEIIPILKALKAVGLRLVLMSNTCITHYEWVRANYDHLSYFDDLVLSYEAGAIKPEPAIYESALEKIQCEPSECFYTDDIAPYIDKARTYGLKAEVFTSNEKFLEHLSALDVQMSLNQ